MDRSELLNIKPEVSVQYYKSERNSSILNEVLYGLEEEGVPYCVFEDDSYMKGMEDMASIAFACAQGSSLGIGILVGQDGHIILHHNKLPPLKPYFSVEINESTLLKARELGVNAGRMVKGIPLKDM